MNCDSGVDAMDVAGFVDVVLDPSVAADCQRYLADVNGDGDIHSRDVQGFVAAVGV